MLRVYVERFDRWDSSPTIPTTEHEFEDRDALRAWMLERTSHQQTRWSFYTVAPEGAFRLTWRESLETGEAALIFSLNGKTVDGVGSLDGWPAMVDRFVDSACSQSPIAEQWRLQGAITADDGTRFKITLDYIDINPDLAVRLFKTGRQVGGQRRKHQIWESVAPVALPLVQAAARLHFGCDGGSERITANADGTVNFEAWGVD